jgi:hypothetical protein
MSRLVYPYASLFKLDNPIAHQGCGPGMYSQVGARGGNNSGPILDVDVFAIPAAFLRGLFGYEFGSTTLTLRPRLPDSIASLQQKNPVFWGGSQVFLSLTRASGTGGAQEVVLSVKVNGTACEACVVEKGSAVRLTWMGAGSATTVSVVVGSPSSAASPDSPSQLPPRDTESGLVVQTWLRDQEARAQLPPAPRGAACGLQDRVAAWVDNATEFRARMGQAGLGWRYEAVQARNFLAAVSAAVTRCEGRANGTIGGIPSQPALWNKYNMSYDQWEAHKP